MKTWLFSLLLIPGLVQAADFPGTGIGVTLGSPLGVTARHWLDEEQSVEGGFGWSLSRSRFQANVSYLWQKPALVPIGRENLDLFFGGGLSLRTKSGTADGEVVFGPRLPVGLSFWVTDPNLELFAQGALNIGLIPTSDLYLDALVGVRFYF